MGFEIKASACIIAESCIVWRFQKQGYLILYPETVMCCGITLIRGEMTCFITNLTINSASLTNTPPRLYNLRKNRPKPYSKELRKSKKKSKKVVRMSPPPAIALGSTEVQVGTNYKSDPSFYAPLDWKENGIDLDKISGGVKYFPFGR